MTAPARDLAPISAYAHVKTITELPWPARLLLALLGTVLLLLLLVVLRFRKHISLRTLDFVYMFLWHVPRLVKQLTRARPNVC